MLIALCDDNARDRTGLAKAIRAILNGRRLAVELREFPSGEALLSAMDQEAFSICFPDIFLTGVSGVAVARRIRQAGPPPPLWLPPPARSIWRTALRWAPPTAW